MVIAHHYTVSSGIMNCFDFNDITGNMIFLQFWGAFGKIAINCFLLITGYYMLNAGWSLKKWLKLYIEIKFYKLSIYALFCLCGYAEFNYHELLITLFNVVFGIGNDYAETYLVLYFLIPFINRLIHSLTEKDYKRLLIILLIVLCIIPSFSIFLSVKALSNDTWNYISWMIFMYLLGGYIRKYPQDRWKSKYWMLIGSIGNILLVFASILVVDYIGIRFDFGAQYWFVNNANKLLALTTAFCIFNLTKCIEIKYNSVINRIGSTTFGIFLIHTSNTYVRTFIWNDVFKCTEYYTSPYLVLHAIVSVVLVFGTCCIIDYIRSLLFESFLYKKLGYFKQQ